MIKLSRSQLCYFVAIAAKFSSVLLLGCSSLWIYCVGNFSDGLDPKFSSVFWLVRRICYDKITDLTIHLYIRLASEKNCELRVKETVKKFSRDCSHYEDE